MVYFFSTVYRKEGTMSEQTKRITVPAAEEILGMYFPVLDHGFVALVDYMGGDVAVEQAARVAYGLGTRKSSESRGLLRYLRRHKHTSPSEMVEFKFHCSMPIFVARQWIRHRTACLAGDMPISFDLPGRLERGNRKHYALTVKQIYDRWQPTRNTQRPDKQRNPLYHREQVQKMHLRCLDEETGEVLTTNITNITLSGRKKVLSVHFNDGSWLRATEDHKCFTLEDHKGFTSMGWLTLKEGLDRGVRFAGVGKRLPIQQPADPYTEDELSNEKWRKIPSFPTNYEVSNLGRIRNLNNTRGFLMQEPLIKETTLVQGYPSISLSWEGKSRLFRVHKLVLLAFVGVAGEDEEARHLDGCRANSRLENLAWGTSQENADDRMEQGGDQRLFRRWVDVTSWEPDGEEDVYDISVCGPHHNFIAGGVVVHNSVNEMSGRYSILPMLFYTPYEAQLRPQSKTNKQGRSEDVLSDDDKKTAYDMWKSQRTLAMDNYQWLNEHDFARELARIDLPLSTYTQWYWKIDLHNLLHFLTLRVDAHAQWEIQQYGIKMAAMLKRVAPISYEAWIDYEVCGVSMSRMEMVMLRHMLAGELAAENPPNCGLTDREMDEFLESLKPRETPDFNLDLNEAKDATYFEAQSFAAAPGK
jgi:thymidylate synthase ThyX